MFICHISCCLLDFLLHFRERNIIVGGFVGSSSGLCVNKIYESQLSDDVSSQSVTVVVVMEAH